MAQKRKTHAIIFSGPERVMIEVVDIPDMTNSDVLIEIEYSSISNRVSPRISGKYVA